MNTRKLTIRSIAIFAALLFFAAPVLAQQASLTVDSSATKTNLQPLTPEIPTEVTLGWKYFMPNQAYTPSSGAQSTATATITVQCPNNILATGPQSTLVSLAGAGAGQNEFPFAVKYSIVATRDLQGLKAFTCSFSAKVGSVNAGPGAVIQETENAGDSFSVSSKFFSLVQAKVATQIKEAGPQKEVPFEIQLDNFGNARTQIQFAIEERPGNEKWSAVVPDDVILDSPAAGGEKTSDVAVFTIQTPFKNGWNNEQGTYRLKMSTFAADDPSQAGLDIFTNVLVRVRGVYVPSLEPMIMVGAVIGMAAVARLRRE